ncbi:MAG TPA: NHLP bacteriocin system secretion protein [Thermoanaerobaculia bacterium]|nr:NHLP bacteriocin system secretion protein [Thermoanaerobaculia bacterium]
MDGDGLLIRGAAVLDVTSQTSGRITNLYVKAGDVVKEGQVVAKIDQPELETKIATSKQELELKIANSKAQLADLQAQTGRMGASGSSIVSKYRAQLAELKEKAATQQKLVNRGILTSATLFRTKEQIASTEQLIAQNEMSVSGSTNQVREVQRQITEMETRLANMSKEATGRIATTTEVTSPFAGRVLELTAGQGSMIPSGGRLMTLESLDAPMETVLYVPAAEGKKVRPGMDVRISPSTVKAEEYGFMLGKVKSVSDFPVTPEGLRRVVRNDRLVEQMMKAGAPIEVIASPIPDKSTPSGFKWSSSKGPPSPVFSGTLTKGSVVVENKTPISYVLPIVKKTLGA